MKKSLTLIISSLVIFGSALSLQAQTIPAVSVSSSPTSETALSMDITVSLSSPAAGGESFVPTLAEGTASFIDFDRLPNVPVIFAAGDTTATVTIALIDDPLPEFNETFQLVLTQPSGLTIANSTSTHTITSDDSGIALPSFFSDGMVLQRNKAAAFWGFVLPGRAVTVQFAGQTLQATAGADGRFEVIFNNLAGSSVGRQLTVTSQGVTETISDVVVGEVWMGAGQSNMEFPLNFLPSPENDNVIATANDPLLRIFVPVGTARRDPQVLVDGDWLSATPGDIPDFSALAYYYGARLRQELGVPIAFIQAAIGGQPIEGFISDDKLETFPEGVDAIATKDFFYGLYDQALIDFQAELAAFEANPVGNPPVFTEEDPQFAFNLAGQIFNGMINPVVSYGMRGILWYQGEANTFFFATSDYAPLLQGLAEDLRTRWSENLPFYYHQLPNFVDTNRPLWVDVQNAQRRALDLIPNSGMVVGNDIGDPNDIHPVNKSEFADRLVLWPLANEYGQSGLVTSGPLYRSSSIQGSSIVVEFDFSAGLTTRDGNAPGSFELLQAGGDWFPANAVVSGQSVVVSSNQVPDPVAVRYAFSQNPTDANLINGAGLPTSVFTESPAGVGTIGLTISASPTNEGLIGLPVTFTLDSPAIGGESFRFSLPSGTAIAGVDYLDFGGTGFVDFAPGDTSQTLGLTIVDDDIFEADETFSIVLTQLAGLSIAQPSFTLTILNDDEPTGATPPTLTISAPPTNEGLIGLPVTFTLDTPALGGESFNFALPSGTAIAGVDYLDFGGTGFVQFAAGETTQNLGLTLIDDTIVEPDETFSIVLTNPTGLLIPQPSLTLTILNDDEGTAPSLPSLTISASPTNEGLIGLPVTFTLDSPAVGGESFSFALPSGTAIAGEDYLDFGGTGFIDFAAGETTQTLGLTLIDDTIVEPDETFSIVLTNPNGLTIPQPSLTLTILNDDEGPPTTGPTLPVVTVSAPPTNEGLIGLVVTFTLDSPAVGGETVNFALPSGTAINGVDYNDYPGGFVEFSPGDTSQDLVLTLIDDTIVEPDETFSIVLSNPNGLTIDQASTTLTILNDDEGPPTTGPTLPVVTVSAPPTNEGLIGLVVTFTLDSPAAGGETVNFALPSGTAINGVDYNDFPGGFVEFSFGDTSQEVTLTLIDDTVVEPDETFSIVLNNPNGLTIDQASTTLTILNDDEGPPTTGPTLPVVTVSAPPTNEGLIGLVVTFTLDSPAAGGETVNFALPSGTAINGVDYNDFPGGFVEFSFGDTSQDVVLTLIDDTVVEPDETFSIVLSNPTGLTIGQASATLTILNDDEGPINTDPPVLTVTSPPTNEGLIGLPVTFTLSRPAEGGESVLFDLIGGVAGSNLPNANPLEDYLPATQVEVEFAFGETSQTLFLTMVDDAIREPDEFFTLSLYEPVGLELASDLVALGILNDDSVLDAFGDSHGLPTAQRAILSDDDGDGIPLFLEYAFNLDPTLNANPDYEPGQLSPFNEEPFGLPVVRQEFDHVTGEFNTVYQYLRRTDSFPKVIYITEVSADAVNFVEAEPDRVLSITDFWEEVTVIIGTSNSGLKSCFARVRVEVEDDNGDGF